MDLSLVLAYKVLESGCFLCQEQVFRLLSYIGLRSFDFFDIRSFKIIFTIYIILYIFVKLLFTI